MLHTPYIISPRLTTSHQHSRTTHSSGCSPATPGQTLTRVPGASIASIASIARTDDACGTWLLPDPPALALAGCSFPVLTAQHQTGRTSRSVQYTDSRCSRARKCLRCGHQTSFRQYKFGLPPAIHAVSTSYPTVSSCLVLSQPVPPLSFYLRLCRLPRASDVTRSFCLRVTPLHRLSFPESVGKGNVKAREPKKSNEIFPALCGQHALLVLAS